MGRRPSHGTGMKASAGNFSVAPREGLTGAGMKASAGNFSVALESLPLESAAELTADDVNLRVNDWLKRLDDLFSQIKDWARANGWEVTDGTPVPMRDELMQRFRVKREQPSLFVKNTKGARIWIRPKGLWVIGANGRVDVYAGNKVFTLLDGADQFEPPQWVLYRLGKGTKGEPFDPKQLADMV
jgi:hypothetical protein